MSPDPDDSSADDRRLRSLVLTVLALVVAGTALDLYLDGPDELKSVHVLTELSILLISAGALVVLWRAWRRTALALMVSERSLSEVRLDRSAWQARAEQALEGMARAIDEQFHTWQLTPAEREVALMLLKGHGHKQIAYRTNRSESTVRQHAVSVYGKSGQGGRAELAAYFLEGLMLPTGEADGAPASGSTG